MLPVVIDELRATTRRRARAHLRRARCLSYRALAERANRYARWALRQGLAKGDVVCLLMPNRPEYMAIWLGITRVGGVVALLNTNLAGPSLAHCIDIVAPKHIIVAAELIDAFADARAASGESTCDRLVRMATARRISPDIDRDAASAMRTGRSTRPSSAPVTIDDRALYIYTSGTTGLPKAANVSHYRLMTWSHWFAGMMDTRPDDRMYNCLPMYHSVGGVVATGAVLVNGGSVVIREKFSARAVLGRRRALRLHAVPVYRRALPLSRATRRRIRASARIASGSPAATACGRTSGRRSSTASRSRRSWSSTPRPKATCRCSTSRASRARSAASRRSWRTASPTALVKFDVETRRAGARRATDFASAARRARSARRSAGSSRRVEPRRPLRGLYQHAQDVREEDPARRVRAGRCLVPHRRPDAQGRAGLFLFRRPHRRHLPLEGRERLDHRGRRGDRGVSRACARRTSTASRFPDAMAAPAWRRSWSTAGSILRRCARIWRERLPAYARPVFVRIRARDRDHRDVQAQEERAGARGYDPAATTDAIYFNDPQRQASCRSTRRSTSAFRPASASVAVRARPS